MFKLNKNEIIDVVHEVIHRNPEKNPLFNDLKFHQQIIEDQIYVDDLFDIKFSPLATEIEFIRNDDTGRILNYHEISLEFLNNEFVCEKKTAENSLSLDRMPTLDKSLIGDRRNFPFKPANVDLKMEREIFLSMNSDDVIKMAEKFNKFANLKNDFGNELRDKGLFDNEEDFLPFLEEINNELLNEINLYVKEFKNIELNEKTYDEKKLQKIYKETSENEVSDKKAPVITLSLKDIKKINYFDTDFVKVLDTSEVLDDLENLIPNPAKTFSFKLDTFQKKAILCLEENKNILVSAHTSAGKTVVAEYAISLSLKNFSKTIYTSPIKALSNQKYRDFRLIFGLDKIGLITGDIQINQDAACLIMTTEILLQMLYNGSEIIRDIEWIIFDEVHYINDKERGHIWEEIFILLPDHINLVLLSATVSNVNEFGDWLGKARNKITYIVYTQKRPVPLEHFFYLGSNGKNEMFFKIIDEFEKFDNIEYNKAVKFYRERELKRTSGIQKNKLKSGAAGAKTKTLKPKNFNKSNIDPTEKNMYIALIRYLQKNDKLPLIFFMFSRKKCNDSASLYYQSMDLCKSREKTRIHFFINNSLQKLKKSDRELHQIINICAMLKNGFGVHHSGILPLLREITEILFQQGLVKVLFTTETFAMGVNMPAKSVAFDSMEKHDGVNKRELLSSEYIQMAGRAGRRGKDKTGTVIIICKNEVPSFSSLSKSISNKVLPIESKFKLTYSMILNILRVRHHLRIECIMEKSFVEHKIQLKFKQWLLEKKFIETELKNIEEVNCPVCKIDIDIFNNEILNYLEHRKSAMKMFCEKALSQRKLIEVGSIIIYGSLEKPFYVGIVLKIKLNPLIIQSEILVIGFNFFDLICHMGNFKKTDTEIRLIKLDEIDSITKIVCSNIKIPEQDFVESKESEDLCMILYEKLIEFKHEPHKNLLENLLFFSSYNPCKDFKMNEMNFTINYNNFLDTRSYLLQKHCVSCKDFYNHYNISMKKTNFKQILKQIENNLSCENLQFLPDYYKRIEILKELNFINSENVLTIKGKVACILSENELLITNLLVDGFFIDITPEQIPAIISCFVFQQKYIECFPSSFIGEKLVEIKKAAIQIDNIQNKHNLTYNRSEIMDTLNFGLVNVIYEWTLGVPFFNVMNMTNVQEGIVVRCIQRIDEMLKNLIVAAKLIGDIELSNKITKSSKFIRRDIVFTASLYVQEGLNIKYKE